MRVALLPDRCDTAVVIFVALPGRLLTRSYPAATTENVTYSYDSTAGGNYGIGRVTTITHEGGSIALTYDARGNILSEARTIGTTTHTVSYEYDAANQLTGMTYPSGREVLYTRDSQGRITTVGTRKVSTDPFLDVASNIAYQPFSNLVQALDYGNGLNIWNTYTLDYELDVLGHYDGQTDVISRAHTRTDDVNLTNIWDNVTPANNQSFWYTASNKLQNADGPWGAKTFYYDAVGNRTHELFTPPGGAQTTDVYGYSATDNRVTDITRGTQTVRSFSYDAAGNMISDSRSGSTYAYAYNNAARLSSLTYEGNTRGSYVYNGLSQLITRTVSNMGSGVDGTVHYVHDAAGNIIAETDGTGATVREYIWIPGVGYAGVALPITVVDGVNTATPAVYYVHTDHLSRPIKMTDANKASVWDATWLPFGGAHAITGSASSEQRFPGQWFQIEAGLHYNWHRHYDASLGRYTQPDPLGFVDGPSVYGYALNNSQMYVDEDGQIILRTIPSVAFGVALACARNPACRKKVVDQCRKFLKDKQGSTPRKTAKREDPLKGTKKETRDTKQADREFYNQHEGKLTGKPGPRTTSQKIIETLRAIVQAITGPFKK